MINITTSFSGDKVLANCSYLYYINRVDEEVSFSGKFDRTIYVYEGSFSINGEAAEVGSTITIKNATAVLSTSGGVLLVAQTPSLDDEEVVKIIPEGSHYKVSKPWGYELWLNGEHPSYCFKKIHIKAGTQTSLQYHNFKEETNFVAQGSSILVFKRSIDVENDSVSDEDLGALLFETPVCFHVMPKTIHRLKAVEDLYLYEVSTPFLDDVIRIQDDTLRGNGRIKSEHS